MSYQVSDKRRFAEHRGEGHNENYKPWIKPTEIHGLSTTTAFYDPRVGRHISLLSQPELEVYLILSWNDDVIEIREQFPLNRDDTRALAEYYGYKHPYNTHTMSDNVMTTDFLVNYVDGTMHAYAVKGIPADKVREDRRTLEKLYIEMKYWEIRDIPWTLITAENIPSNIATNIRQALLYWDPNTVYERNSLILHLIAHKSIITDMTVLHLPVKQLADALITDDEKYRQILTERKLIYANQ